MLVTVVVLAPCRCTTSATPTARAAPTPATQPLAIAQASTGAADHSTGNVGDPAAMWAGSSMTRETRIAASATARSGTSQAQVRLRVRR